MAKIKVVRPQTRGEEIANTISHGMGALLAMAGAVPLIVKAVMTGSGRAVVGVSLLYAASLIALYVASTVYHGVTAPGAKRTLRSGGPLLHLFADSGDVYPVGSC